MNNIILNYIIVRLDKLKLNNPKVYVGISVLIVLLSFSPQILSLFGIDVSMQSDLDALMKFVAILATTILNPKTNRYLIKEGLKDEKHYTVKPDSDVSTTVE